MEIQKWRSRLLAKRLREGAVIAYPTEGVWGLGCLPEHQEAVVRLLQLKGRAWQKGLIMVAASMDQALPYVEVLSPSEVAELDENWPGPVTYLLPKSDRTPVWVSGESDSVAIRVSGHPVIQGLCRELGGPIISTSANPSGKSPALSRLRLKQYFGNGLDEIVPGKLGGLSGPTEIRDFQKGTTTRQSGATSQGKL
jgi:L-threonylcarbamoyladenylate synthase